MQVQSKYVHVCCGNGRCKWRGVDERGTSGLTVVYHSGVVPSMMQSLPHSNNNLTTMITRHVLGPLCLPR
jgi:hypothetical protein